MKVPYIIGMALILLCLLVPTDTAQDTAIVSGQLTRNSVQIEKLEERVRELEQRREYDRDHDVREERERLAVLEVKVDRMERIVWTVGAMIIVAFMGALLRMVLKTKKADSDADDYDSY